MILPTSDATEAVGRAFVAALRSVAPARLCVWLCGELGAGKTTFCRGVLRAMGYEGRVPSPTYTLIEPYDTEDYRVYHLDLYRLSDPQEIDFLGVEELWEDGAILLIEWPEHAGKALPAADIQILLRLSGAGRELLPEGRSPVGLALLEKLTDPY